MIKNREIIHKILDEEADEGEIKRTTQAMESDSTLREEFSKLQNAVRMLKESERHGPPIYFTAEVMKRLPRSKSSVFVRVRDFLFGRRVLHWNIASALGMVAIAVFGAIMVSRVHREPFMNAAGPGESAATVRLTFYAPQARTVTVAGDFNKWKTDVDEMKQTDGMWQIELKLKPGVYSYSFVVDGKSWVADPGAQSYTDDGFGSQNALLRVAI